MIKDDLITPIAYSLLITERMMKEEFGALNDEQAEIALILHRSAVDGYRLLKQALRYYEDSDTEALAHMLHDLFSPSATMLGYLDYWLEDLRDDSTEKQERVIRSLVYRLHHMRRMAFNLVEYARLQTLPPDDFTILKLHDLLSPEMVIIKSDIELRWDVPEELPAVFGNRRYVARSFINVLTNALQYTEEGVVDVRTRLEEDMLVVRVRDTGIGIAEEHHEKIFEPFFQVKASTQGLGLGLSVARDFMRLIGGDLMLTSAPDRGSSVQLYFPIADPSFGIPPERLSARP
jgi:signal transduction histidine kinase